MKSYATTVLTLYTGILDDATATWPDIGVSLKRDMSRLRRAAEDRGLEFFTLTLPSLGPWFDSSLDQGYLRNAGDIPRGVPIHMGRPRLFAGVLSKIFSNDGMLRASVDVPTAVLFYRTLIKVCGKLETKLKGSAERKSVEEFFNVDNRLPQPFPSTWGSEDPRWERRRGHPLRGGDNLHPRRRDDLLRDAGISGDVLPWDTLRELSRRVTSEFGLPRWWELQPKHGPGAVAEGRVESKYDFQSWPQRLDRVFPFDWFGSPTITPETYPSDRIRPSRLVAVPKDRKAPRLICVEPTSNQWMQQSIWRFLEERVNHSTIGRSISFRSQLESQKAALRGSLTGKVATLDLSEASDRLSANLVEYIFQDNHALLDMFHSVRTEYVEQKVHMGAERLHRLRKFSTMGSALTFPVQSIVFTILCVWAYRLYQGRENDWLNWKSDFDLVRVFGDDLIVPIDSYRITTYILHECGLRVNTKKSYGGSNFRESCGMDAFQGVDVTPPRHRRVYDGSATSTAALIEFSNNLHEKGFWRTSDVMLGLLPPQERKLLWVSGPDEAALNLKTFVRNVPHFNLKYDKLLQRYYGVRLAFTAKVRRTHGSGNGRLLQFFTEDPAGRRDRLARKGDVIEWLPGMPIVDNLRKRRSRVYL